MTRRVHPRHPDRLGIVRADLDAAIAEGVLVAWRHAGADWVAVAGWFADARGRVADESGGLRERDRVRKCRYRPE